jgi:hypothetical protein
MPNLSAVVLVLGMIWLALATLCSLGDDLTRAGVMAGIGLCWFIVGLTLARSRRPPGDQP